MNAILEDIRRDETIAELRAEVEHWKRLAIGDDLATRARLAARLNLTPAEAWLLAMLYRLNGNPLSADRIRAGMPGNPAERYDNRGVTVIVHRVRRKILRRDFIQTVRHIGYSLSPEGIQWVTDQL